MNKKLVKIIAVCLCAALICSCAGIMGYAAASKQNDNTDNTETAESKTEENIGSMSSSDKNVKEETVYIVAGADGTAEKIVVSDWIKNSLKSDTVNDKTELKDVECVKGDSSYTLDKDSMLAWDAGGEDIYYQGTTDKTLPVDISISYKLDGKSISADDLAGKSGKVTIRFDYKNNLFEEVEINGKTEKIYVPFAMLTGVALDNETCGNVEISNGKLINDGDRTFAVGIAFQGLQQNLDIDSEEFEIPSYVEITADVNNFELETTLTVASNEVFNDVDGDKLESLDSVDEKMEELTDAMDQLLDGSSALYDGICTLLDKSGELISGVDKLAEGAKTLKNGAAALGDGAGRLCDGAEQLSGGLYQLEANSDSLVYGAKQVFQSLLSMADEKLAEAGLSVSPLTIDNYASVLNGLMESVDETAVYNLAYSTAYEKVSQTVRAQESTIRAAVTEAVKTEVEKQVRDAACENVKEQVLASQGLTKDTYAAGIAAGAITEEQQLQIELAIESQMGGTAVKATIESNINSHMASDEIKSTIDARTKEQINTLIDQNMKTAEVQSQITAALEQAKSAAASLSALKEQLDNYNQFYYGLQTYTDSVASAAVGAESILSGSLSLKNGADSVSNGAGTLYSGLAALQNGGDALADGIEQLKDGSMQLSDGLKEFNEKGIQKIIEAFDGDYSELASRLQATVDVSKAYQSFAGISEDMRGQVKFVYRTEAVKADGEASNAG